MHRTPGDGTSPRRHLTHGLLAAAALACALAIPAAPARAASDWSAWSAGSAQAAGAATLRTGSTGLTIALGRRATPGARAWFRVNLPTGASSIVVRFRTSRTTPGARVVVSDTPAGTPLWSARPGRAALLVVRVNMTGRRSVVIGLRRTRRGTVDTLRVRSYSVSATPAPASVFTAGPIMWGARVAGSVYGTGWQDAPWGQNTLARFEQNAGKGVSLLLWGQPWLRDGAMQRFAPDVLERVRQHGSIPVVDWTPWDSRAGREQTDFQLRDVIDGRYDDYIRQWAAAAAAWGHPFFVRPYHEMNGTWYPWSERRNGNHAGEFVQAWRHIHDLTEAAGATNITWVWSPNDVQGLDGIPLKQLYPGDDYVDWMGFSSYNWGVTAADGDRWREFRTAIPETYAQLQAIAPAKPIMITELGSSEVGGSKSAWITDALGRQLPGGFPAIKAIVWWNQAADGGDWPIESSSASNAAFRSAIGRTVYLDNRYAGLNAAPIPAP